MRNVFIVSILAAALFSVMARSSSEHCHHAAESVEHMISWTGAEEYTARPVSVLLDLDDDISDRDANEFEAELEALNLGSLSIEVELLSESAQLYRAHVPGGLLDDLRRTIVDEEELESAEIEHMFVLSPSETEFVVADAVASDLDAADGGETFNPNDPYYKYQWHLDQIQMPDAWVRSRGEGVVVAVIDTGVLYRDGGAARRAPDLADTGFVPGYDFVDDDDTPIDGHGHGTHVAGTIAQSTNNGLGVAGVAPDARIMPIRVLDDRGAGSYGSVAAGIRWAVDNGAQVLNLSLGGPFPSQAIRSALEYAREQGVLPVVAAGNTGRGRVQFPASYDAAFAVGAVRYDEQLSFYSSFGSALDIVAPGGDLRVDQNRDGLPDGVVQNTMLPRQPSRHDYLGYQGTSMAAPHVAGVAALIYASGVTDPNAVQRIIEESAKSKRDKKRYGHGLVQANDALLLAAGSRSLPPFFFAGLLALFALRKRKTGTHVIAKSKGVFAALTGSALFVLVMPSLNGLGAFWPLVVTVALPLAVVALFNHTARGRLLAFGVGAGLAGWLVGQALVPTMSAWGLWTGVWLLAQAVLCVELARLAIREK